MKAFNTFFLSRFVPRYDQGEQTEDFDPFIPEMWAFEAADIIDTSVGILHMVNRDYEEKIQEKGDTVNIITPASVKLRRKGANAIQSDNPQANKVSVKLNQQLYTSFLLPDKAVSMSEKDLFETYLQPGMDEVVMGLSRILAGASVNFIDNCVGELGAGTKDNIVDTVIDARKIAQNNRLPSNRYFLVSTDTEALMLKTETFRDADKTGDGGLAIMEGYMGRKMGLSIMAMSAIPVTPATAIDVNSDATVTSATAVNFEGDIPCTNLPTTITVGQFVTFSEDGNRFPYRITAISDDGGGNNTGITLDRPLRAALSAGTVVNFPMFGLSTAAYASEFSEALVVDGIDDSFPPAVGMVVGIGNYMYTIIAFEKTDTNTYELLLDIPLEADVADNAVVAFAPAGSYNMILTKPAVSFVSRPLARPRASVESYVVKSDLDVSLRVIISYDDKEQKHRVTVDILCGVVATNVSKGVLVLT